MRALAATKGVPVSFQLKKEISITDFIALFAIIISCISLWKSFQPDDGFIVSGGGLLNSKIEYDGKCHYLLSIPVEYHNSGKRALTLQRFVTIDLPKVLFIKSNGSVISEPLLTYKSYQVNNGSNLAYGWLKHLSKLPQFQPEKSFSTNNLIKPGDTFFTNIVVDVVVYQKGKALADSIAVAFDAEFSNGQVIPLRVSTDIEPYSHAICGS
jgi:hypothetical protein